MDELKDKAGKVRSPDVQPLESNMLSIRAALHWFLVPCRWNTQAARDELEVAAPRPFTKARQIMAPPLTVSRCHQTMDSSDSDSDPGSDIDSDPESGSDDELEDLEDG